MAIIPSQRKPEDQVVDLKLDRRFADLLKAYAELHCRQPGAGCATPWFTTPTLVLSFASGLAFICLLHKVADHHVTLDNVHTTAFNPDALAEKTAHAEAGVQEAGPWICLDPEAYLGAPTLHCPAWHRDRKLPQMIHEPTLALRGMPRRLEILFAGRPADPGHPPEVEVQHRLQLDAVKRWYGGDWTRIETKLRTSIVEGISVFLSLFDDDRSLEYSFCPPETCHAPIGAELLRVVGDDGHTGRYQVDQRHTSGNVA